MKINLKHETNAKKTREMYIGKVQYKDINLDGATLERVSDFTYLGSNGACMAKKKMIDLRNLLKDKNLPY